MAISDKRELILDLLARDKTGAATKGAAKNIGNVGDAADKTSIKLGKFSESSEKAERKADDLGDQADGTAHSLAKLDAQIKLAEHELKGLARAFADTDNAAERLDISKVQRKLQQDISRLSRNKSLLDELIPNPQDDGKKIGKSFGAGFLPSLEDIKSGPAIAAGITAAAPLVGAVMSAAVIGAAGAGGIIGGVLLASKDARVQAAGKALGQKLLGDLQNDAGGFVGPVLQSIAKIEARFGTMNTKIKSIFNTSSSFLGPLVDGAITGVDAILRGVNALVTKGKPVMDSLGKSFGTIGNALGDALVTISGDSKDAAKGLDQLANAAAGLIKVTGWLVRGLTETYGVVSYLPSKVSDLSKKFGDFVGVGDRAHQSVSGTVTSVGAAAVALTKMGAASNDATHEVRDLDKEMSDAANSARDLYGATTDTAGAIADATDQIKQNGRSISLNTKEGRSNRTAVLNVANAMIRQHDAYVKANGEGKKSASISQRNRDAFIALAIKAGYAAGEAKKLADKLGLIPSRREVKIVADTATAASRVQHVRDLLNKVHSKKISVSVLVADSQLDKVNNTLNRLGARATGGPVTKGTPYWVGEQGPELVVPDTNARVLSASASRGMANMASPSRLPSSGGVSAVRLELVGQAEIVSAFRYLIRTANLIQA